MTTIMDECAYHEAAPAVFAGRRASQSAIGPDVSSYAISNTSPAWMERAVARLNELGRLPDNWNSYGAAQISVPARLSALTLLRQIVSSTTPMPAIIPTNDGSVQLEWHCRGIDLEVRLLSSSRMRVSFEDLRGIERPIEDEFDYDLRDLVRVMGILSTR